MKWPETLMLVRHAKSIYNNLKNIKGQDHTYQQFVEAFATDPGSKKSIELAHVIKDKFALCVGDWNTPIDESKTYMAVTTGEQLKEQFPSPDVIFVSPFSRTLQTLELMKSGWPDLRKAPIFKEERIREQEYGIAGLYNDWRVFHVLHPEQRKLYNLEGRYWYRFPQGENVADVRLRNRSWLETITREFSEKRVLVITHHLNILATRANLERLTADKFISLDKKEKPLNCGVTLYRGNPRKGKNGKMELEFYNGVYY